MQLQGERLIRADRATVWRALNDPDVLRTCIPGCDELERTGPDTMEGQVTQKVGPVKARFRGAVTLSDVVEAESYRIDGEGKGGAAGFVKGGADVRLSDDGEGNTRLAFDADAKVGGKLAQLGNRLVDGFARKMTDQFFDRFKEELEGPGAGDATPPVDKAPDEVVAAEAAPAVAIEETSDSPTEHPAEAPGAAGPTTRDEPVSGASARPDTEPVDGPRATSAGAGPAGGTEAPTQAAMAKRSADVAARQQDPSAEPRPPEGDPAKGPADTAARAGTDGVMGGAGSDAARIADTGASDETPRGTAPERPKKAAPKPAEPQKKKGWFARLFGL